MVDTEEVMDRSKKPENILVPSQRAYATVETIPLSQAQVKLLLT